MTEIKDVGKLEHVDKHLGTQKVQGVMGGLPLVIFQIRQVDKDTESVEVVVNDKQWQQYGAELILMMKETVIYMEKELKRN